MSNFSFISSPNFPDGKYIVYTDSRQTPEECGGTPLSCLEPTNIFAGVYNPNCGGFADPSKFQAERAIFSSNFNELINNYGVNVKYYVNGFNVTKMNLLYGEHPTQEYLDPFFIKSYIELEESVNLSQFGMSSDDELTAYISIKDFVNKFIEFLSTENADFVLNESGVPIEIESIDEQFFRENNLRVEPKSDDLIEITVLGCDRPGDRGSKIFRITEVLDQSVKDGINPAMGHYIWKIRAKRYETSHETNAPMERGNDQVYDNSFSGKEDSSIFPSLTSSSKIYDEDVDNLSKTKVYNMDNTENSIYGDYY